MKLFIIMIFSLIPVAGSSAEKNSTEYKSQINKTLGINKINFEDVGVADVFMESVCQGGRSDEGPNNIFALKTISRKALDIKGFKFPAGTGFSFCDNFIAQITLYGGAASYMFDGYNCGNEIAFTEEGDLCTCRLAKDSEFEGVLFPKDARVFLKDKKLYAIMVLNFKKESKYPATGAYLIEEGKIKAYADDHHLKCFRKN